MFLSVIIPAYNEEKRIGSTLESMGLYFKRQSYDFEVIVVANNCNDGTSKIVKNYQKDIKNLKLIEIKNHKGGKGRAIKIGIEEARGKYILFMDADNSTRIYELDHLLPYFNEGYDVVIGSRAISGAEIVIQQPFYREIFGRLANKLIRIILLPGIFDTQCGFKVFSMESAKKIFNRQRILGWGFDMEILALARYFGYKIKEEPVVWYNSPESKVSFLNYFTTFWELFKIKWNLWRGKYD